MFYSYKDPLTPPWIAHLVGQIVETIPNCHVLQAEGDKDVAIANLARDMDCPIISSDSDFLLFATSYVIKYVIILYLLK